MSQPFTLYRSDSLGRASNCMYPHAVEVTDAASLAAAVSFDYVAVEIELSRPAERGKLPCVPC